MNIPTNNPTVETQINKPISPPHINPIYAPESWADCSRDYSTPMAEVSITRHGEMGQTDCGWGKGGGEVQERVKWYGGRVGVERNERGQGEGRGGEVRGRNSFCASFHTHLRGSIKVLRIKLFIILEFRHILYSMNVNVLF